MDSVLKQLDRQFRQTKFHCVVDDQDIWSIAATRAWVLHELIVRVKAGGHTGVVLPGLMIWDARANAGLERDYYCDMKSHCEYDLQMIKEEALLVFGSP